MIRLNLIHSEQTKARAKRVKMSAIGLLLGKTQQFEYGPQTEPLKHLYIIFLLVARSLIFSTTM